MTGDLALAPGEARWGKRVRLRAFVLAAVLHLLAAIALVRAFAPDITTRAVERVVATFAAAPEPSPTPRPQPSPAQRSGTAAGAAGAAGKRAVPKEVAAPAPRIVVARRSPAPQVAASGSADRSGARAEGAGSGASGAGAGPGSGGAGNGAGAGGGSAPIKIAGEINSARDYPIASREQRIGDHVVVAITVGPDGQPTACRVVRASRDPAADAITCRLALARFRFRPATDSAGQPIAGTYGWQQRWFYKDGN